MPTSRARHLGISIERPAEEVYAFLAEPQNFPQWAEGLGHSFDHVEGMIWAAQTPMGPMRIAFSEPNAYGIADHAVIPADGPAMHNPMRVMPNGSGSEVVFTLFQRSMTDDEMARDAGMVMRDLAALKALLER
ncbi:MAG TPA: SRPBCC family protein [Bosea sp. (in: a-proteobacteria)]|uniref:SRPBCC family protein n=1 Tax=Bosea sp. (in: a-proteobacteria) TaxID=1871050 RepID=UPI002E0FC959|nr:SRPBCC family protein [Bosea sp. (in: a-proteobacteria)]